MMHDDRRGELSIADCGLPMGDHGKRLGTRRPSPPSFRPSALSSSLSPLVSRLLVVALITAGAVQAQTFHFADGKSASIPPARIAGNMIVIPLKGSGEGTAEVSQPFSKIVRMEWPAPGAVAQAGAALSAGKPADALKLLDSVLPPQEPFRDIPGSWWMQASGLRVEALARLGRDAEAEALIQRLRKARTPDAAVISRAELSVLEAVMTKSTPAVARTRLAALAETTTDDTSLARLALLNARLHRAEGRDEEALLAYLRVPVLYPNEAEQLPSALLGAGAAFKAMGEDARAQATWQDLAERFPKAPEAAEAQRELAAKK